MPKATLTDFIAAGEGLSAPDLANFSARLLRDYGVSGDTLTKHQPVTATKLNLDNALACCL